MVTMGKVRLINLIGSYTIIKRDGECITLVDRNGQRISDDHFRIAGGYKQDRVVYVGGELKTHIDNVIDWL